MRRALGLIVLLLTGCGGTDTPKLEYSARDACTAYLVGLTVSAPGRCRVEDLSAIEDIYSEACRIAIPTDYDLSPTCYLSRIGCRQITTTRGLLTAGADACSVHLVSDCGEGCDD